MASLEEVQKKAEQGGFNFEVKDDIIRLTP